MNEFRQVALIANLAPGYVEGVIRGVGLFARPKHRWLFHLVGPSAEALKEAFRTGIDGIIVVTMTEAVAGTLKRAGVPMVNTASRLHAPDAPHAGNDDAAIGRLAARHFLDRGFHHFAYVGLIDRTATYVAARREAFVSTVQAAGHAVQLRSEPYPAAELARWLNELPRPVAVMACDDRVAWQVVEACRAAGLRVPEQAAVLGVDDDQALCHLAWPPMSSVATAAPRIGAEAAGMLHALMSGRRLPQKLVEVPPLGIVTRQSTDVFAVADPDITEALRFIERRATGPLRVDEIAAHVALGRRTLEQRFGRLLGRTPHEEVLRVRLDLASQMLVRTSLSLSEIAQRCGFGTGKRLSTAFRRFRDATPSSLRKSLRL